MPPIANHARRAYPATVASNGTPAAGRPGLVGVIHVGPTQK